MMLTTDPRVAVTGCWPSTVDRKSTRLNSSHTEIYTLSLHDALPISQRALAARHVIGEGRGLHDVDDGSARRRHRLLAFNGRSEEHTSELQSHRDLHSFPTRRSSDLTARPGRPPRHRRRAWSS